MGGEDAGDADESVMEVEEALAEREVVDVRTVLVAKLELKLPVAIS